MLSSPRLRAILRDTGEPVASSNVSARQLIMVDAANFASAEGDRPDYSTSTE
jgi:hypothetical protein